MHLIFGSYAFSQCAGESNTVTICDKEADITFKNYNLFDQLLGSPTTGGTWSSFNPANNFALDTNTGVLNLWSINRAGMHLFTYTNSSCDESATITINLGGYPGEDNVDGGANACSDDIDVNLYTFLDNDLTDLNADTNGEWTEDISTATGFLVNQFFDAEAAGPGTYSFIYTTLEVDTCVPRTAKVVLEVHRAPEAGEASNIIICESEDFSLFTNINLFDWLEGEDTDGIWSDSSGTNQITSPTDSTINVEEIYANFGPGTYDFEYTVFSKHGVCSEKTSIVTLSIPNITGNFSVDSICNGNSLRVNIFYKSTYPVDFSHDLVYEIVNATTNDVVFTGMRNGISLSHKLPLLTASHSFTIPDPTTAPGKYFIRVKEINNIDGITCKSLEINNADFLVFDTKFSIEKRCYEGDNVLLNISEHIDTEGNLSNANFLVSYTIEDLTNSGSVQFLNQPVSFSNGNAVLPVDISNFPVHTKQYKIKITNPAKSGLDCLDYVFEASLVPDEIKLDLIIDNTCNATKIQAEIDAPPIGDGTYTITYEVVEVGTTNVLIDNTISYNSSGGSANLDIDISSLETGNYQVILKSIQNDTNPCRTKFNFEITKNFSIAGIPDPPTLDLNQVFCAASFSPNAPTLSDIAITTGTNLTWYEDQITSTPLNNNTTLEDGKTYYVTASDPTNSCESSDRALVTVKIIVTSTVITGNTTPFFCSIDTLTLNDFEAEAENGEIIWYDAPTGGNKLDSNTIIENGISYFAVERIDTCEHNIRSEFKATVVNPPTPKFNGNTERCALDKLTLFDIESEITENTNFNLLWYDADSDGNELSNSNLIEQNITYYAVFSDPITACEGQRIPITFNLSKCNPEDYDFFIPDGFSPNNDGTNDYFFIPHIEFFYPNYEFEIFNRYGQSLFKGDINNAKWNGNNTSGNEVTNGVYFYILNYNKDSLPPKQGRIYLSK